jgi:hypothetical protein
VTAAWLTAALGEGEVVSAHWETIAQDRGFTGLIGRVTLTGAAPASLIVKLPMAERERMSSYRAAQTRDSALARRYFERATMEARFYREIHHAPAPGLYYSAVDDARQRVVLLLEDLTPGRPGDALHGCSIDEAALVLERMSAVYALSPPERFPVWGYGLAARQERYDRSVAVFLERFGDRFPAEIRTLAERLRSRLAAVVAPLAERGNKLIHADLHLDNVIFDAPPGNRVVVIDWQTVCVGHPALDFVNFVFSSLTVEDRRAAEQDLHVDGIAMALLNAFAGTVIWLAGVDPEELSGRERMFFDRALSDGRLVPGLLDHGTSATIAV